MSMLMMVKMKIVGYVMWWANAIWCKIVTLLWDGPRCHVIQQCAVWGMITSVIVRSATDCCQDNVLDSTSGTMFVSRYVALIRLDLGHYHTPIIIIIHSEARLRSNGSNGVKSYKVCTLHDSYYLLISVPRVAIRIWSSRLLRKPHYPMWKSWNYFSLSVSQSVIRL